MSDCVNLAERFGKLHRIGHDPAFAPKGRHRDKVDPWVFIIPCRHGEIYPYGGHFLVIEVEGHRFIKAALIRLACCELIQDGDDFGAFKFHVDDFEQVAEIVRPHRKPQYSKEQMAETKQRLAKYHFKSRSNTPSPGDLTLVEASA